MIDFNKLDKTKTYLGLQYGTSLIAKKIKKYSKCYAPDSDNIPTHVLALVYREFRNVENANMDCFVAPAVFARYEAISAGASRNDDEAFSTSKTGDWWIYESHADAHKKLGIPAGVRRFKKDKWLEVEKDTQNEFECVELNLNFETLEEHIGEQYGTGDIAALMRAAILNRNGKQKDRNGLICSEYIALAYPAICEYYDLPPHCITPAHFQDYIDNTSDAS